MARPELCARCGEEVRWGWRPGRTPVEVIRTPPSSSGFWMHRDPDIDHHVVLGRPSWETDWELVEATRAAYATDGRGPALQIDEDADDVNGQVLDEDGEVIKQVTEKPARTWDIPPPEVYATPVDVPDPHISQGAKNKIALGRKNDWTVTATYSRASRVHAAHGNLLGVADYLVVRFTLDGSEKVAVACWEDGGIKFVYIGRKDHAARRLVVGRTNDSGFKAWLKHEEEES